MCYFFVYPPLKCVTTIVLHYIILLIVNLLLNLGITQNMTLEIKYTSGIILPHIHYTKPDFLDLNLAYAITIYKLQESEFDGIIIPVVLQHINWLYQNLIYTALTDAKRMAIFVKTIKTLGIAVRNIDNRIRIIMMKVII